MNNHAHERQQLSTLWRLYMQAEKKDKMERLASAVAQYTFAASEQLSVAIDALNEIAELENVSMDEAGTIARRAVAKIELALKRNGKS